MIIDLILDRKDGVTYNPKEFYDDIMGYYETMPDVAGPIAAAMDGGEEDDVRRELKKYIDDNEYNPKIKDYIDSCKWLVGGMRLYIFDYVAGMVYETEVSDDEYNNDKAEEVIKSLGMRPKDCSWMYTSDDVQYLER